MSVAAALAPAAGASSVILNEYNAVSSGNHLEEDDFADSDKADSRLGRIQGNGGNWIELAVVGDGTAGSTVDMRGWALAWEEDGDQGTIFLSNDGFWSAVPAGTLVTVGELETVTSETGGTVVNGSDVTLDFATGDNWAHVWSFDTTYVSSTTTNVTGDGSGNFSVGNDNWNVTIYDSATLTNIVFGPEGEGISDGGVNSNEVYKLEENATPSIVPGSANYSDGTSSTFGQANIWSGGDFSQDFTVYGVVPEPATLALLGVGGLLLAGRGRRQG